MATAPSVQDQVLIRIVGGVSMRQSHLVRQVPANASPRYPLPPRRVYTPTPNGFERFLRGCVGLARDERTLPHAYDLWPQTLAAASSQALSF
jgi:hypothetical protein